MDIDAYEEAQKHNAVKHRRFDRARRINEKALIAEVRTLSKLVAEQRAFHAGRVELHKRALAEARKTSQAAMAAALDGEIRAAYKDVYEKFHAFSAPYLKVSIPDAELPVVGRIVEGPGREIRQHDIVKSPDASAVFRVDNVCFIGARVICMDEDNKVAIAMAELTLVDAFKEPLRIGDRVRYSALGHEGEVLNRDCAEADGRVGVLHDDASETWAPRKAFALLRRGL